MTTTIIIIMSLPQQLSPLYLHAGQVLLVGHCGLSFLQRKGEEGPVPLALRDA
jgi:hypothetical protein